MTNFLSFLWKFFPEINEARQQVGGKLWYRSKTVIINLLSLGSAMAVYWLGPQFGVTGIETEAIAVGLVNGVNVVLRFITGTPLALPSNTAPPDQ